MQGFQILSDPTDAFGGVTSCLLDHISDVYPGKCSLAFPLSPCHFSDASPQANSARFLNYILSLRSMTVASSTTVTTPLTLSKDAFYIPGNHRLIEGVDYKPELPYHTPALLPSALHLASLPWRRTCPQWFRI